MFGATFAIPLIVAPAVCVGSDYVATSEILGTILFVSGLITIAQATFGNRYSDPAKAPNKSQIYMIMMMFSSDNNPIYVQIKTNY